MKVRLLPTRTDGQRWPMLVFIEDGKRKIRLMVFSAGWLYCQNGTAWCGTNIEEANLEHLNRYLEDFFGKINEKKTRGVRGRPIPKRKRPTRRAR